MSADRQAWRDAGAEGPVSRGARATFTPDPVLGDAEHEHVQSLDPPPLELSEFEGAAFPCRYIDQAQNRRGDAILRFAVDRRYVHLAVPPLLQAQGQPMHADFRRWRLADAARGRDTEES
jgi:hypothetical protein